MKKDDFVLSKEPSKVLVLEPYPFSVSFSWIQKNIKVQLDNGEDVLKLAQMFSNFLTNNNISNTIFED